MRIAQISEIITNLIIDPYDAESIIIPIAEELTPNNHDSIQNGVSDAFGVDSPEFAFIQDTLRNNDYNA